MADIGLTSVEGASVAEAAGGVLGDPGGTLDPALDPALDGPPDEQAASPIARVRAAAKRVPERMTVSGQDASTLSGSPVSHPSRSRHEPRLPSACVVALRIRREITTGA